MSEAERLPPREAGKGETDLLCWGERDAASPPESEAPIEAYLFVVERSLRALTLSETPFTAVR